MTIKAITQRAEIQSTIHTTAAEMVKLLESAVAAVVKSGGDESEARESILSLVNDEDE